MATVINKPGFDRFKGVRDIGQAIVQGQLKAEQRQRAESVKDAVYGAKDRNEAIEKIKALNLQDLDEVKAATQFADTIWPSYKPTASTDSQLEITDALAAAGLDDNPQNRTRWRQVKARQEKDLSRLEKIGADKWDAFSLSFDDSSPAFIAAVEYYNNNAMKEGPDKAWAGAARMLRKLKKGDVEGASQGPNTGAGPGGGSQEIGAMGSFPSEAWTSVTNVLGSALGKAKSAVMGPVDTGPAKLPANPKEYVNGEEYQLPDGTVGIWDAQRNGFVRKK